MKTTEQNKARRETKFERECKAVAEALGIDAVFFEDKQRQKPNEDDGYLHVTRRGIRACFNVSRSQMAEPAEQNETTREVLRALGEEVTPGALVEETDPDDICCPYCGRNFPCH